VLEFDQNPNGLRDELLKEPISIDRDGMIPLPQRPGLGIELDPAAIDRYRIS
jgi:D-galactarolactone cycloisomerase